MTLSIALSTKQCLQRLVVVNRIIVFSQRKFAVMDEFQLKFENLHDYYRTISYFNHLLCVQYSFIITLINYSAKSQEACYSIA